MKTEFAPPERKSKKEIDKEAKVIEEFYINSPVTQSMLDSFLGIVMMLNENRQIIFTNGYFNKLFNIKDPYAIYGKRPGEALRCVHSGEAEAGCGTTIFCVECGAVNAILTAQKGGKETRECRIIDADGQAYEFAVTAVPIIIFNKQYIIFAAVDLSHEKRRRLLERIFFHDVLNTASIIWNFAAFAKEGNEAAIKKFSTTMYLSTKRLIDEIVSQQELLAAENDELKINPIKASSLEILGEVAISYGFHREAKDKKIEVDKGSVDVKFTTDPKLMTRVLSNMIKNALEASKTGETVTCGCRKQGNKVEFWVRNKTFIPKSAQLQIFQRSFSTKGIGRGVGTYSMKLLAERYLNGKVSFTSDREQGTMFKLEVSKNTK